MDVSAGDCRFRHGLFLRSSVEKSGNFIDSSHRIATSEHIYRIGVSVQLSTMLPALWLATSLYAALRPANRNLALAAFSFRLSEVVLGSMWIVLQFLSSSVHIAADHAGMFSVGQLSELSELLSQTSGLGVFASLLVVAACFVKLILPEYTSTLDLAFIPTGLSEVTTGFGLMVKGLNHESPPLKG